ncbi:glycosyltransferase family 2 protein [Falsibacillus pallidus]|uniref:glycosyltransferase family 2 protein n=1 Tax=Falsibacillus pallidus TaxID=493781 RepID=UPI003D964A5D
MFIWFCIAVTLQILLLYKIPVIQRDCNPRHLTLIRKTSVIIINDSSKEQVERLVKSIFHQEVQPYEILIVGDKETLPKLKIEMKSNVYLLEAPPVGIGWKKKNWDCWHGAKAATGDYIIFIDSSTWFEPGGMLRIMEAFQMQFCKGILTISPYKRLTDWINVFSSAFSIFLFSLTTIAHSHQGTSRYGGFEECFICRRDDYFKLGGHYEARKDVLPGFAITQSFLSLHQKATSWSGKYVISKNEESAGWKPLFRNWNKSSGDYIEKARFFPLSLITLWILSSIIFFIYCIAAIPSQPILSIISLFIYIWSILLILKKAGSYHLMDLIGFPIHLIMFTFVFFKSCAGKVFSFAIQTKEKPYVAAKEKEKKMD